MRITPPIILIGLTTLITFGINSDAATKNITQNTNQSNVSDTRSNVKTAIDTANSSEDQDINNIYQFLLADIAISRQQRSVAIENFQQLLKTTQDPEIAEILTELAIETENYQLSLFAAKQWAELSPNNFNAQLIAIAILLGNDQLLVEKFLQQAIKIDPKKANSQLSGLLPKLSDPHKLLLEKALKSLVNQNPNNPTNQLCLAQIAAQLGNIKTAEKAIKITLQLKPNLTQAIFLQAKLIRYSTKSDTPALNYLHQQVVKFTNNEELSLFYANALLDNNKNTEALLILKKLLDSKSRDYALEANLLTAEIYLQKPTVNIKQAKIHLNKLINTDYATSKVYFMLGQIAEQQMDDQTAIHLYTSIEEEPYHIVAFLRAALLLANNQQLLPAIDILNQAQPETLLEKKQLLLFKIELALELKDLSLAINNANEGLEMLPNDIDFLYAHSVISSLNNQMLVAEKDLKHIITIQPENHNALNALGFILTLHTNRQQEAFNYLQQALQLSPGNPLYMDSMGWLLYHMGKIPDSLEMLSNAYKISDNLNIAVHFGEVLWNNGQKQKATAIWKKAWQTDPNDLDLLNTLNQYQISFKPK